MFWTRPLEHPPGGGNIFGVHHETPRQDPDRSLDGAHMAVKYDMVDAGLVEDMRGEG